MSTCQTYIIVNFKKTLKHCSVWDQRVWKYQLNLIVVFCLCLSGLQQHTWNHQPHHRGFRGSGSQTDLLSGRGERHTLIFFQCYWYLYSIVYKCICFCSSSRLNPWNCTRRVWRCFRFTPKTTRAGNEVTPQPRRTSTRTCCSSWSCSQTCSPKSSSTSAIPVGLLSAYK